MEIKFNSELKKVAAASQPSPARSRADVSPEAAPVFEETRALEAALGETPDVRPEMVARGQALVGSVDYPPVETMQKLARLLALNL